MDALFFSFMAFSRHLFFDLTFICRHLLRSAECLFYNIGISFLCWNNPISTTCSHCWNGTK